MADYISTSREARDLCYNALNTSKGDIGIGYVGTDDEQVLPKYPAVVCSAGPRNKTLHATHTWQVELRTIIWVYHANLGVDHRTRSNEDLMLVEAIESLLELDLSFGDTVINGYIENEQPGVFQPQSQKGKLVVGTRMTHYVLTQARF